MINSVIMPILFNFFLCLMITMVTPACISGQENQVQSLDHHGVSNIQISVENSECGTCKCSKKISYLLGTQKVNWFQANVLCKQSNMELAHVNSKEEQIALENYTRAYKTNNGPLEGYWLAGTRHGSANSDFVWLNTGKPVVYRNFAAGQPDNAGGIEACLEIFLNGPDIYAWNDIPCDQPLGFICQSSKCCCCT